MKTVKFLSMLIAMAMLGVSCGSSGSDDEDPDPNPNPDPGTGALILNVSPAVIQANGQDAAQFEVLYNGKAVTEGVTIYDAKTNSKLDLPSLKFTTTTADTYSFWANYKTENTGQVNVTAVDQKIPEQPADAQPSKTDFVRRSLLVQFTGTNCPNCPAMVTALNTVLPKAEYASSIVLAAAHRYNASDPAYLASAALEHAMGVSSYPTVVADMHTRFEDYRFPNILEGVLTAALDRESAKAGIAVNSALSGNTLVVRASVKVAETGEYRVGAWLLEDGIYGKQANNGTPGNFDTHDNCIRIADSRVSSTNYTGLSLGSINKGSIGEHVFVMNMDSKWVKENCRLVVFVSTKTGNKFYVNNVVKAAIGEQVSFDYK